MQRQQIAGRKTKSKSVKKDRGGTALSAKTKISMVLMLALCILILVFADKLGDRNYYIASVIMMIAAMVPFFVSFEDRKPHAREIVTLAVMCGIAVASRAAFIMLPHFKPMTGIIVIAGMAFGSAAGFLAGAISGFVSNFIFGQGPWTPWQMFAYGIAGFIGGLLAKKGVISPEKKLPVSIFGAALVMIIVGPILDTCTVFTMSSMVNTTSMVAVYASGIPVNAVHATATFLTLFVLCKPMHEKLERIKIKYGMMEQSVGSEASFPASEQQGMAEPQVGMMEESDEI